MLLDKSLANGDNSELAQAFPASVQDDILRVTGILPHPPNEIWRFRSSIEGQTIFIPYRIHHDPAVIDRARLTPLQEQLLDCLLTRHHNGFVREKYLRSIVASNQAWIPPFVVQLVGEYVMEILIAIRDDLHNLDPQVYRRFLLDNPTLLSLTKARVTSYWDCYYRCGYRREDYAGFQIVNYLERLTTSDSVGRA